MSNMPVQNAFVNETTPCHSEDSSLACSAEAQASATHQPPRPPPMPSLPSKHLRSWPKHRDGGHIDYLSPEKVLTSSYASDAHTAGYCVPQVPKRLSKEAPLQLAQQGSWVGMAYLFVDVDGQGHKVDAPWRAAEANKVELLREQEPGFFYYETRGGYRLIWRLATPFLIRNQADANHWKLYYGRFLLMLSRRFGIVGDPACSDWTRLYRLPHATRDQTDGSPGQGPEALPTRGDPSFAISLTFEPTPDDLEADLAEARRLSELTLAANTTTRGRPAKAAETNERSKPIHNLWGAVVKAQEASSKQDVVSTSAKPSTGLKGKSLTSKPPTPNKKRARSWAEVVAGNAIKELAQTAEGGRNNAANAAGFKCGQVAHLLRAPGQLEARLLAACEQNGLVGDEGHESVLATIKRSFEEGKTHPMTPPAEAKKLTETRPEKVQAGKQTIRLANGLASNIEQSIRVLSTCCMVFVRGNKLVELISIPDPDDKQGPGQLHLRGLPRATLREKLCEAARWLRRGPNGKWVETIPSDAIVSTLEARGQWPGVLPLLGIMSTPFLRKDGSVCDRPDYDAQSWFWLAMREPFEPLPERPTHADARQAMSRLMTLFVDFPFASEASKYVPIAALLTILVVPALDGANMPAFLASANTPSSGKGLLFDVVCLIVFGRIPFKSAWRPNEEMEKVLGAIAHKGSPILFVDNISPGLPFGGSAIELVLTCSGAYTVRLLGTSEVVSLPWRTVTLGTGNNIVVAGDTRRRVLVCELQSPLENPEDRKDFQFPNLKDEARRHRMAYVRAALTLLRAYIVAGCPSPVQPLGSFEEWSRLVPSAIVWAGGANVLDAMPRNDASNDDPTLSALKVLLIAWPEMDPTGAGLGMSDLNRILYGTQNASGLLGSDGLDGVREAFEILAPCKTSNARFDPQRLGRVLRAHQMRNLGGRMFRSGHLRQGAKVWCVIDASTLQPILKAKEGD